MESGLPMIGEGRDPALDSEPQPPVPEPSAPEAPVEIGGREGPEPTPYGDWEKNGRCIDF
jgi:hypothetical protein